MAKVDDNIITRNASGRVGNIIFKKYKNYTVMSKEPDMSNVVFSKKQKAVHAIMAKANLYGQKIIADPKRKAQYARENKVELSKVYYAAIQEYFEKHKK